MRSQCLLCVATIISFVILTNFVKFNMNPMPLECCQTHCVFFFCISTIIDNNIEDPLLGFDY